MKTVIIGTLVHEQDVLINRSIGHDGMYSCAIPFPDMEGSLRINYFLKDCFFTQTGHLVIDLNGL